MPSFMESMKGFAARKETQVNPPEAQKVLETQSAPEVANASPPAPPVASAAPPAPSVTSEAAPAVSTASAPSAEEAPKAKRGRPAGSKNAPKPAAVEQSTEDTSAAEQVVDDSVRKFEDIETWILVAELFKRGYGVTNIR